MDGFFFFFVSRNKKDKEYLLHKWLISRFNIGKKKRNLVFKRYKLSEKRGIEFSKESKKRIVYFRFCLLSVSFV
ncbi:hypothetical protein RhiirC2_23307 [Rhizophagus irregularis]|uniref:Uncharacterized protein n=1 Tax=Rhizophagus irregularis TaxID=588596 RepID=A0A2N1MYE3_9GLOM|nr:hypothetical protein RhiirC2_23307 [Rhizophagus irregularis]